MMTDKSDLIRNSVYKFFLEKAMEAIDKRDELVETLLALHEGWPAYLESIGEIAITWSSFETDVDLQTLRLAGIHLTKGFCLTSQISGIGRKLDAFASIARRNDLADDLIKQLNKISTKAISLAERRNRMIHDSWSQAENGNWERIEITARKLLRIGFVATSITELKTLTDDIISIHDDFTALADLIVKTHPPSPGNRP
jgi:hypothetical protein